MAVAVGVRVSLGAGDGVPVGEPLGAGDAVLVALAVGVGVAVGGAPIVALPGSASGR